MVKEKDKDGTVFCLQRSIESVEMKVRGKLTVSNHKLVYDSC